MEILYDALIDIRARNPTDFQSLLTELRTAEDSDYAAFAKRELSGYTQALPVQGDQVEFHRDLLFRRRSICRTGLLPAESRFLGIMFDSDKIGSFSETAGYIGFDDGMDSDEAMKFPNEGKEMRFVKDTGARQQCEVPLNQDFKDYWYIQGKEDWQSITLPNKSELETYGTGQPLNGVLAICLMGCPWGKCQPGDVRETQMSSSDVVEIRINGVVATRFTSVMSCVFPHTGHNETFQTWKPNDQGQFEIEIKLKQPGDYMRISSFAVW